MSKTTRLLLWHILCCVVYFGYHKCFQQRSNPDEEQSLYLNMAHPWMWTFASLSCGIVYVHSQVDLSLTSALTVTQVKPLFEPKSWKKEKRKVFSKLSSQWSGKWLRIRAESDATLAVYSSRRSDSEPAGCEKIRAAENAPPGPPKHITQTSDAMFVCSHDISGILRKYFPV